MAGLRYGYKFFPTDFFVPSFDSSYDPAIPSPSPPPPPNTVSLRSSAADAPASITNADNRVLIKATKSPGSAAAVVGDSKNRRRRRWTRRNNNEKINMMNEDIEDSGSPSPSQY